MKLIKKAINILIDDIVLKLKMLQIKRQERKIEKLQMKLSIERIQYEQLLKEHLEWCNSKITIK